ncbi:hypothetical protein G3I32_34790 [Streptomyces coelicoflavus]|uniref:Uncharacterized protein n=1 Tax=Streptomyces coelicoflavus TaxID=285562 RepID=A0A7K3PX79_9ACTN|nr:hypothetical protein [Streptomyces coelicoflavus]NEB13941.1 hypothetical protein [Streptomyces coelicoflavus]
MSDLYIAAGLAGALVCLVGHRSGDAHSWGPQLLSLGSMILMALGLVFPGVCAATAAFLWSMAMACADSREWGAPIDLGAMALLMELMTHDATERPHVHMAGMTDVTTGTAALVVVIWVTARAGDTMFRQVFQRPSEYPVKWMRGVGVYRQSGAVVMILSMAAMFL